MRKFFSILSVIILMSSCDKVDELTKFDLDYKSSVVIESATNLNLPFDIITPEVETNSESEFAINDTRKDLIEEIKLKSLTLQITAPEEQDFSFLESVEIYIAADGLEEVQIATITDITESIGRTLELETSGIDIKEYIKKDNFYLRLNTVTDKVLTADCSIDVLSVFFVDAKIFGI